MKTAVAYFGVEYPSGCALSERDFRVLAKGLFMNPCISASQAKTIIDNPSFAVKLSALKTGLSCDFDTIIPVKAVEKKVDESCDDCDCCSDDDDVDVDVDDDDDFDFDDDDDDDDDNVSRRIEVLIDKKLPEWVQVFGEPSEDELIEVGQELKVRNVDRWVQTLCGIKTAHLDTPEKIAEYLSSFVVGQSEAVNSISVIIHEHKMRMETSHVLPKSPCLLIGDTGTGKSYLIKKVRETLNVPKVRVDCTKLVPEGIVGSSISDAINDLYVSGGSVVSKAAYGILHFDEFDKLSDNISYRIGATTATSIQQEMLALFDLGEKINFSTSMSMLFRDFESMPTSNLMLVFSGAFHGIEAIIYARLLIEVDGKASLIDKSNLMRYCSVEDIQKYGIIPELAGRLSRIVPLNKLDSQGVYSILTKSNDSELAKYIKKFELMNIALSFADDALRCIADMVASKKIGARYINTILMQLLDKVSYNCSNYRGREFVVDAEMVRNVFVPPKHKMLFMEFEKSSDIGSIASRYNIDIDELLDIYLVYNSQKKGV